MLQWQEHFLSLICHSHLSSACWRVTTGSSPICVIIQHSYLLPSGLSVPPDLLFHLFSPSLPTGWVGRTWLLKVITIWWKRVRHGSKLRSPAASPTFWWLYNVTKPLMDVLLKRTSVPAGREVHKDKVRRERRNNNNLARVCNANSVLSLHLESKCKFTHGERGKGSRKPKNTSNFLPWLTDELSRQQKPLELLDHLPSSLSIFNTVPFIHVPHLNLFSIMTTETLWDQTQASL